MEIKDLIEGGEYVWIDGERFRYITSINILWHGITGNKYIFNYVRKKESCYFGESEILELKPTKDTIIKLEVKEWLDEN